MNRRLGSPDELAKFIRNFPSDPEVMARVRKQLAEHVPAKRRLPDGTLEKTREELEAEIARLEAFIQHESEGAIEAAQEIIRLRKDKLRLHDVYSAQYARATEYWGEVERLRKENDRLRAQLGPVDGDMRDFTDEESAAYEAALDRLFAEGDDADDTQENNGR